MEYIPKNNAGPYNSITTAALMPSKEYMSCQDMLRRDHESITGLENIVNQGLSAETNERGYGYEK